MLERFNSFTLEQPLNIASIDTKLFVVDKLSIVNVTKLEQFSNICCMLFAFSQLKWLTFISAILEQFANIYSNCLTFLTSKLLIFKFLSPEQPLNILLIVVQFSVSKFPKSKSIKVEQFLNVASHSFRTGVFISPKLTLVNTEHPSNEEFNFLRLLPSNPDNETFDTLIQFLNRLLAFSTLDVSSIFRSLIKSIVDNPVKELNMLLMSFPSSI